MTNPDRYDVVVIGGSFSGASAATLLCRRLPDHRVLVVEQSEQFDKKVGEATVEVSAFYLHRVLGLYDVLSREHLPKHGLRYWFSDGPDTPLAEMSEIGPANPPSMPTFQIDRSRLDETLLAQAASEGAEVARPAKVVELELGWPESRLTIETEEGRREIQARWVVDASGRHAYIARRLRLHRRIEEHPTAAVWARFRGVRDLDDPDRLARNGSRSGLEPILASRRLATNHFCGYGWWCWMIPLAGGETSVGLVYNKELFSWESEGSLEERFLEFVRTQPGLRELMDEAEMERADFRSYGHLPYTTSRYMDRGWALVGDAATFLDPFYSPGLDWASISVTATVDIVARELGGELVEDPGLDEAIEQHNGDFERSVRRYLSALYLGKYEIMGDAELMAAAFFLDTGSYFKGVVSHLYEDPDLYRQALLGPDNVEMKIAHWVLQFYNQRLVKLARFRRAVGTYGRKNRNYRHLEPRFSLGVGPFKLMLAGIRYWMRAEGQYLVYCLRHFGPPRTPTGAETV